VVLVSVSSSGGGNSAVSSIIHSKQALYQDCPVVNCLYLSAVPGLERRQPGILQQHMALLPTCRAQGVIPSI
jgi:hypothetical protein